MILFDLTVVCKGHTWFLWRKIVCRHIHYTSMFSDYFEVRRRLLGEMKPKHIIFCSGRDYVFWFKDQADQAILFLPKPNQVFNQIPLRT
jgi:hypothetical protein